MNRPPYVPAAAAALLPREIGNTGVHCAAGTAAGDWVFATGLTPYLLLADAKSSAPRLPLSSVTLERGQANSTFDLLAQTLGDAGSDFSSLVRFDQYYTTPRAVDAYHQERMIRLSGKVPPSTSMLMRGLLLANSVLDIQAIAVRGERARELQFYDDPVLSGPPTSGFCAAVRCREFVFVPGFTPSPAPGGPSRRGIALEAGMPEGSQWKGTPIELETRYIIERKLAPALALAGASLKGMVKAQVYLTDPQDMFGFLRVWSEYVGGSGPALTIVPSPQRSIGLEHARIEVNAIALTDAHLRLKRAVDAGLPRWLQAAPNAVQAGDLLFLSGLMPLDGEGEIVKPLAHESYVHIEDRMLDQANAILERATRLCTAADTTLENGLRFQFFLDSIGGFRSVYSALRAAIPNRASAYSFIEATPPAWPTGAMLQGDFWVYCPQQRATTKEQQ